MLTMVDHRDVNEHYKVFLSIYLNLVDRDLVEKSTNGDETQSLTLISQ